jgi:23S rRNA (adenine2503-C2)-methyltransferase
MFSYTLLLGINDSEEDARGLARLALEFAEAAGQKPRLSVIPYNEVAGAPFERAPAERLAAFRKTLHDAGVGTTLRYSGGGDIGAACGQLGAALMAASGR